MRPARLCVGGAWQSCDDLVFIANDPRVPKEVQEKMRCWGIAKDEFMDRDGWPHQIYVREARRMIGQFVMTENHLTGRRPTPDSVGMGSYTIDSHNVQRYITPEGQRRLRDETLTVIEALSECARSGRPHVMRRDLGRDLGMCCGGRMEVLIEPVEGARLRALADDGQPEKGCRTTAV